MTKTAIYQQLLLLAALPAFMLASCTQEEMGVEQDTQSGEIRFEIGFAPQNGAMQTDAQTRVATNTQFASTWEDGDEIGVFAVEHGAELAASGNLIHNVKLTYNAQSQSWSGPIYWPTPNSGISSLDFYAYYPYDADATDPTDINFDVHTDQSKSTEGKRNYNLSDLLMAKNDNDSKGFGKGDIVKLSFSHALAMVQVDVSKSMISYPTNMLKVWLNGCTTDCVLNLSTQSATQPSKPASPERIKMYPCPKDDATGIFAYRALVPVQTIDESTVLFSFEYDGSTLLRSEPLTEQLSLVAGRAETFDITFPFVVMMATANVNDNVRLDDLFSDEELATITHLKVEGQMKDEDFYTIRNRMPLITNLDLGEAIVFHEHIPNEGLKEKDGLQKFTFPSNIKNIGHDAFGGCSGLTGPLIIPDGVSQIGHDAFRGCSGLTGPLIIPDGVSKIDGFAFAECSGFTSLTIPASVTELRECVFMNCTGLTSITCHIQAPVGTSYSLLIFEGASKDIPLYVPAGRVEFYENTPPWNEFNDIQPIL